jgi:excisionase family DNA binding protein
MTPVPIRAEVGATAPAPRFYTVAEAAVLVRMSKVTIYRAIRAGEFPAMRVRGRVVVPAKAIDALVDAIIAEQSVVDAAGWAVVRR